MSDLIDRQAAIENIKECAQAAHSNYEWDMEQGYINAIECLEELPSAQPEQQWIPCSERLPESDVDVLTQYSDYSMSVDSRTASSSGWFWADGEDDLPIAWMPLPEPYKAESEEKG